MKSGEAPVQVSPFDSRQVFISDFSSVVNAENERELFFFACLQQNGEWIGQSLVTFVKDKHLVLSAPRLTIQLELAGGSIHLEIASDRLARFIEISLAGADVVFNDNYFDLVANEPRMIQFQAPEGWSLEQIEKNLQIKSLVDSY